MEEEIAQRNEPARTADGSGTAKPSQPPPAASNVTVTVDPRMAWGLGSAAALVVGSLGTWVTVGPFSVSGTADGGDGVLTLVLGLVAGVLVLLRRAHVAVGVLAAIALAIGATDTADVSDADSELFSASVGWGLILVDVAAASLLAWALAPNLSRWRR